MTNQRNIAVLTQEKGTGTFILRNWDRIPITLEGSRASGGTVSRRRGLRQVARVLLAGVRLANGATGLLAPQLLIRRIDPAQAVSPAGIYAFRLFGVRTVLLGAELLIRRDAELQRALRQGLVIHASDVATSVLLGVQRQVTPRTSVLLATISAINVALAVTALEPNRRRTRRRGT